MAYQVLAELIVSWIRQLELAEGVNDGKDAWSDKRDVRNCVLQIDVEAVDRQKDFYKCGYFLLGLWTRVGCGENASFVRF